MRVHERRNRCRGHAEFIVRDLRGAQRRRNHPRRPPVSCGDLDCHTEHRRLPAPRCTFHDHERISRSDRGGSALLPSVQAPPARRLTHVRVPRVLLRDARGDQVAQLGFRLNHPERREVRHMLRGGRVGREDREAILYRQRCCHLHELAYLGRCSLHIVFGHDPCRVLLHRVPCPRRTACGAAIQRTIRDGLHGEVIQQRRLTAGGSAQRVRVVAGFVQLVHPGVFFAEGGGLLRGPLVRPGFRGEAGGHDRPDSLARMRRLPFRFEPFQVSAYLLAAFAHHAVEPLELDHLARYRIKCQAVPIQHLRKLRVRGDDSSAEGADRALLREQRRSVQRTPLPGRPDAGANLEVDMPVRVTRPRRAVRHRHRLQLLNGHNLLLPTRPDTGHGVLCEPALNLRHSVLLRPVESVGDFRVKRSGNRQRLRRVHDHLRESGRPLPPVARQARLAHRLLGERIDPVHPARVRLWCQPERDGHVPVTVERGELRRGRVSAQVVVIGARAVGLDITARIGPGSPEQDHTAMHEAHRRCFLVRKLEYLPR